MISEYRTYREWGRRGPPRWTYWAATLALVGIIVGLLVAR